MRQYSERTARVWFILSYTDIIESVQVSYVRTGRSVQPHTVKTSPVTSVHRVRLFYGEDLADGWFDMRFSVSASIFAGETGRERERGGGERDLGRRTGETDGHAGQGLLLRVCAAQNSATARQQRATPV